MLYHGKWTCLYNAFLPVISTISIIYNVKFLLYFPHRLLSHESLNKTKAHPHKVKLKTKRENTHIIHMNLAFWESVNDLMLNQVPEWEDFKTPFMWRLHNFS